MEELICYFNGQYMKESEVRIALWDSGLTEGGVYDVSRSYNHVPFFWKEHIDRLFYSARGIHLDMGMSPEEVYDIYLEVFKRNERLLDPEDDFWIVHRVTPGAMPRYVAPPPRPTVIINCAYLSPLYETMARFYREGIHLVVASTKAIPPQCLDPKIKHTNRLCNNSAEFEAKMVDPKAWALMLDINGRVAEGPRYNCFVVRDGRLLTPRLDNILSGVTRATLLRLAKELGIDSVETDLYVYDFYTADEIFVTATSFTIYPVARFNERELAKPIPGPITQQLLSAFSKLVGFDIVQRVISYVQAKAKATR